MSKNGNGDNVHPVPPLQTFNGVGKCQWCGRIADLDDVGVCDGCYNLSPKRWGKQNPKRTRKRRTNIKKVKNVDLMQRRL